MTRVFVEDAAWWLPRKCSCVKSSGPMRVTGKFPLGTEGGTLSEAQNWVILNMAVLFIHSKLIIPNLAALESLVPIQEWKEQGIPFAVKSGAPTPEVQRVPKV